MKFAALLFLSLSSSTELLVVAGVSAGVSAQIGTEIVDICHCDDDSGLCGIISKPASPAADEHVKDPKNEEDFVIDEEVDGGCCVELCQANCDLDGNDEEAYGRKLDDRRLKSAKSTKSPKGSKGSKGGCSDYEYCEDSGRKLGDKPSRNLCINMECCKDLRGGPPQCVPEGTCKAVHEHW
eukprot:CAMPEP_0185801844 /NCGR_PEP_ID=MMETSP1322-20130828/1668_1 /TAXON_ID=265543 /ORGANISM="Minutocellus polymorphus, Strain RCC2270" /LENGTH=180 /DNA_ID=CAMNT_0028497567 /DNA_START=66 /DNA_END=605 /DNA_ORIENTATION=-